MLEDYRKDYKKNANNIPGWEELDKNELCNLYIQNENNPEIAGYYFSAIMYKYWYLIHKFYKLSPKVVTYEDVYEWLVDSVIYALEHRMWLNPESSIYQDKNGPDKVINRCMACRRFTFYQAINRKKRKAGFGIQSIDEMMEEFNDNLDAIGDYSVNQNEIDSDITLRDFIRDRFIKGDSLGAFASDIIAYSGNVFDQIINSEGQKSSKINISKLVKFFQTPNKNYLQDFSKIYDIPLDIVKIEWEKWGGSADNIADQLIPDLYLLSQTPYLSSSVKDDAKFNSELLSIKKKKKLEGEVQLDFGTV